MILPAIKTERSAAVPAATAAPDRDDDAQAPAAHREIRQDGKGNRGARRCRR